MIRFWLAVSSAVLVVLAACSSDSTSGAAPTGVDGGPLGQTEGGITPPGTGGEGGAVKWTETECGTCALGQCTREKGLCDAEPTCAAHAKCVAECPADVTGVADLTCIANCPRTDSTAATRARAAYDTCVRKAGGDACAACKATPLTSTSGLLAQTCGPSTDPTMCGNCEDRKCCDTYQACVDEPECKQQLQPCLVACKGNANPAKCKNDCYAAHPTGVPQWARRETCILANCAVDCNNGNPIDPCVQCSVVDHCRDEYARCSDDVGCYLIRDCIVEKCPILTDDCLASCKGTATIDGAALFDAYTSCSLLNCEATCL